MYESVYLRLAAYAHRVGVEETHVLVEDVVPLVHRRNKEEFATLVERGTAQMPSKTDFLSFYWCLCL